MFTISQAHCDHCGQDTITPLTVGEMHLCTYHYSYYAECGHCGIAVKETDTAFIDGFNYCPDCLNEKFFHCEGCGDYCPNEEKEELEGNYYCESCYDEHGICEACDDVCSIEDMCEVDSELYCQYCFDHNFFHCEGCGVAYPYAERMEVYGDFYCPECFHDEYEICDDCGDTVSRDEVCSTEGGEVFCVDCYGNIESRDCPGLLSYDHKPAPIFHKMPKEKTKETFGIELEVEALHPEARVDNVERSTTGLTYCKRDYSLPDTTGFEVVSHPFTWGWHKTEGLSFWDDLLNDLLRDECRSYDTGSCGIHIHISKSTFTTVHLYKFLKLYYDNLDLLQVISQRDAWSSSGGCQWGAGKECPEDTRPETWACKARSKKGLKRYTAVNLQNSHTVEVRIFRGTLNAKSFRKNLEFIKASIEFTKSVGIKDVTKEGFLAFVANSSDYLHLWSFLIEKGQYN